MKTRLLLAAMAILAVVALLSVGNHYGLFQLSSGFLTACRWVFVAALIGYGIAKRSLTTWIIVAMIIGAEIGHDWPAVANNLRVVSQIFLRLIKVIIAPLLFATLVSGIAAHSDLKKVGRMGIKAIVYFEVVTTLALFIGLAAINISKAGVGVKFAPPAAGKHCRRPILRQLRPFCMSFPRTLPSPLQTTRSCRLSYSASSSG